MIYVIPLIFKTILLILCLSCALQTLARFFAIRERIEALSNADAEWMACAQRKANLRNIAEAYTFLSKQKPLLHNELLQLRERFENPLREHRNDCVHALFPTILSSIKKQNQRASHPYWPNWIYAAQEVIAP